MTAKIKINSLTAAQEKQLAVYRDKWLGIGLDCAPFEKGRAEAAVREAYRCAGLAEPRVFIHLESPLRGAVGAAFLAKFWNQVWDQVGNQVGDQVRNQVGNQVWNQVWDQVRNQVWDQVGDQVWNQVWDQVWDQVGNQVRDQVWDQVRNQVRNQVWDQVGNQVGNQVRNQVGNQVWNQVGNQVWDQVGNQVRDQVGDQVGNQVRDQVRNQVGNQVWNQVRNQVWDQVGNQVWNQVGDQVWDQVGLACYGQHDASWLGFYDYFREACGLAACGQLKGLSATARECGWWWPFADAVIITPKARVVNRDDRGRLHCETGPAIVYPDGWGIWAIHGVRVPQQVIEQPDAITVAQIESERNTEVRRVMIERYGLARFLVDSGAEQIHADDYGVLYRKQIADDEPLVMVKVVNSTAEPDGKFKDYFLRVPPDIKTARAAVAWTFGKEENDYEPVLQT